MYKNFFLKKNNNRKIYFFIFFILILIFLLYLTSIYFFIHKTFFTIKNLNETIYYIIPKDKEGEKVKFVNKKGINNFNQEFINFTDISKLNFTIQLYSDINYKNIENYLKKILINKYEILNSKDIFVFSISTQVGIDYFISYKSFNTKIAALDHCEKLSFVKKCLVINPQNL
tara:strand:+ start:1046 stop:1561 length:516 start_codon:yes stop_codon:yes gene_type:complete